MPNLVRPRLGEPDVAVGTDGNASETRVRRGRGELLEEIAFRRHLADPVSSVFDEPQVAVGAGDDLARAAVDEAEVELGDVDDAGAVGSAFARSRRPSIA